MCKEYILSGTVDELTFVLKSEFKLTFEESKFFLSILLRNNSKLENANQELDLLFTDYQENFNTSIFHTRHSISLTDFKVSFLKKLFIVLGTYAVSHQGIEIGFLLDSIVSLYESYTYIEDQECCVYFRAIVWKKNHNLNGFKAVDLLDFENSGICTNLDKDWKCPYLKGEKCNINETSINDILNKFCEKKVMYSYNKSFNFKL